jgi:hypothetical protein
MANSFLAIRIRTCRVLPTSIFYGFDGDDDVAHISTALILVKVGFIDGFFMELLHRGIGLRFVAQRLSVLYLVQEHVLSKIECFIVLLS